MYLNFLLLATLSQYCTKDGKKYSLECAINR